jgi:hypothetical protein
MKRPAEFLELGRPFRGALTREREGSTSPLAPSLCSVPQDLQGPLLVLVIVEQILKGYDIPWPSFSQQICWEAPKLHSSFDAFHFV